MGAFTGAKKFFENNLITIAKKLKYREDNILILEGKEAELKEKYKETFINILSCNHNRDKRTPFEYAQDLVASWLIEDYFLEELKSNNYQIVLDSADKERKILKNSKVSSKSDFKLILSNQDIINLELVNDYTGYWSSHKKLHLRDSKYDELKKSFSFMLAVSIVTNEFMIIDFKNRINSKKIASHFPYGGKSAYEIDLSEISVYNIKTEPISAIILATLKNR